MSTDTSSGYQSLGSNAIFTDRSKYELRINSSSFTDHFRMGIILIQLGSVNKLPENFGTRVPDIFRAWREGKKT